MPVSGEIIPSRARWIVRKCPETQPSSSITGTSGAANPTAMKFATNGLIMGAVVGLYFNDHVDGSTRDRSTRCVHRLGLRQATVFARPLFGRPVLDPVDNDLTLLKLPCTTTLYEPVAVANCHNPVHQQAVAVVEMMSETVRLAFDPIRFLPGSLLPDEVGRHEVCAVPFAHAVNPGLDVVTPNDRRVRHRSQRNGDSGTWSEESRERDVVAFVHASGVVGDEVSDTHAIGRGERGHLSALAGGAPKRGDELAEVLVGRLEVVRGIHCDAEIGDSCFERASDRLQGRLEIRAAAFISDEL